MSGRADHAAARWADDDAGVEEAGDDAPAGAAGVEGAGSAVAEAPGEAPASDVASTERGGAAARPVAEGAGGQGAEEAAILTDVAALTAQRDEYLESLQRLMADFDNYRKRVARLQQEQGARAEANLVTKLLPVLDNLDLAWAHLGPRGGAARADDAGAAGAPDRQSGPLSEEARAIGQARQQLLDVLAKEGLERVDAVDVPFDPTVHDAVAHAPGPAGGGVGDEAAAAASGGVGDEAAAAASGGIGDEGAPEGAAPQTVAVDEVLRAGYRWRGQVLRPAMVRVRG